MKYGRRLAASTILTALLSGGCEVRQPVPEPTVQALPPDAVHAAQTVIEHRCVVCHACYDAPCQLNLQTYPGLERGASKETVYNGGRLLAAEPSRLGIDARSPAEWRERDFHPVLPEASGKGRTSTNIMLEMLALKAANPLPEGVLDPELFDFSVDRENACPTPGELSRYTTRHAQWGMPFGLPALAPQEQAALSRWLATGAVPVPQPPLGAAYQQQVEAWETFLNRDDLKGRLVSRYIYEHLFLGTIYLTDAGTTERFQLLRSTTPPGQPIQVVATRRPFDDPEVDRVYYRLQRDHATVVRKRHMPYVLNAARMQRWQNLFYDDPFQVTSWPGYEPAVASNPFIAFEQIPTGARYRFMLDEAHFTIDGFIKGPVCRGQIALDVIEDRFWVFFMDPEFEDTLGYDEFLASELKELDLPAEFGSNDFRALAWRRYAARERRYVEARAERRAAVPGYRDPHLDQIWTGNDWQGGHVLTVFRHFDSASVVKGLVGADPKTAWFVDYPLLERIHYLLVAGYDVYGNVAHQLFTRLYMDFLRIEGELQFVSFLPPEIRRETLEYWYRDAEDEIDGFIDEVAVLLDRPGLPGLEAPTQQALLAALRDYTGIDAFARDPGHHAADLAPLRELRGGGVTLMPELALLTVDGPTGSEVWSVLRDSAHSNVASPFNEADRRLPGEDALTLTTGFVGAHPNALFRVDAADLPGFVEQIRNLRSEADYRRFMGRFGVRRSDPGFWAHSDDLHQRLTALETAEQGLLDYGRLENR